jgi:hypothetical protein
LSRIAWRASWNPIRQIVARYLDKWTPQSGGVAKATSPEPAVLQSVLRWNS